MGVWYACMGCVVCPAYSTTYKSAAVHLARSSTCNSSLRGMPTVVLPNRPADLGTRGSGLLAPGLCWGVDWPEWWR